MGLMRYILKLWKLLRGTSGEFGRTRVMFTLGPSSVRNILIAVHPQKNQKPMKNVQAPARDASPARRRPRARTGRGRAARSGAQHLSKVQSVDQRMRLECGVG